MAEDAANVVPRFLGVFVQFRSLGCWWLSLEALGSCPALDPCSILGNVSGAGACRRS